MVDLLFSFIDKYGLIAILLAIAIEYACFPIPSEVVLPLCGALAFTKQYDFFLILFLSLFASLVGSSLCYIIGRTGGVKVINWLKKRYPKSEKGLNEAEIYYTKYSLISVSVGRIIPLCRTYISFISGSAKQNYLKFIFFSSLGIITWNAILITLGYKFYENLDYISKIYNDYKKIIIIIVIIILIISIIVFFINKRRKKANYNWHLKTNYIKYIVF